MKKLLLTLVLAASAIGANAWQKSNELNWDVKNANIIFHTNQEGVICDFYISKFDTNGNKVQRTTWTNHYGHVYESERIVYTYDDKNHCVSEYRTFKGQPEEINFNPVDRYEYQYDENGNLIEKVFFDTNDFVNLEYKYKEVYTYDSQNRCTTEISYMYSESEGFYEYDKMDHVYDANGYLTEENYYSPNNGSWNKRSSVVYTNNEKGNCVSEVTMIQDDNIWRESNGSKYEYTYDAQGNMIQSLRFYNGEAVEKRSNTYNAQGQLTEEITYESTDLSLIEYKTVYEYNANGDISKLTSISYYNGVENFIASTHTMEYEDYMDYLGKASGICGEEGNEESVSWSIDTNGILTISGAGSMMDYSSENPSPWTIAKPIITKVVIGEGVKAIGDYTFYGCTELKYVDFSSSAQLTRTVGDENSILESIGKYAFGNCSSLEAVSFPASLKFIDESAFEECVSIRNVVCHSTTPPEVKSGNFKETLWYDDITNVLHVPAGTLDEYKNAEWTQYFTEIVDDADNFQMGVESHSANNPTVRTRKVIDNGKIIIEKDDKRYNILGAEIE